MSSGLRGYPERLPTSPGGLATVPSEEEHRDTDPPAAPPGRYHRSAGKSWSTRTRPPRSRVRRADWPVVAAGGPERLSARRYGGVRRRANRGAVGQRRRRRWGTAYLWESAAALAFARIRPPADQATTSRSPLPGRTPRPWSHSRARLGGGSRIRWRPGRSTSGAGPWSSARIGPRSPPRTGRGSGLEGLSLAEDPGEGSRAESNPAGSGAAGSSPASPAGSGAAGGAARMRAGRRGWPCCTAPARPPRRG